MNRGLLSFLIVVGVAVIGGGAAYYLTETYGEPEGFLTPAEPAPPPPPPLAPPASEATAGMTFEQTVGAFDFRTQRLVWVLPPGVKGLGPWTANVTVTHGGEVQYESSIPLNAERLPNGTYDDLPRGAEAIRLSAGEDWPSRREEIRGVVDRLTAEHGPGGGELSISSDFRTEITPAMRDAYCLEDRMPGVRIYIEQGTPSALTQLELGGSEQLLRGAILSGCES